MSINYNSLKTKVEKLPKIATRPMFGYQCYSISGKFFVGFSSKNDYQVIVRLPKEQQESAVKSKGIKPFSHGAKMGWIEIDSKKSTNAYKWAKNGYDYAKKLAKNQKS